MIRSRGWLTAILLLAGVISLQAAGPDTQWLGVLWTKGGVSVGSAKVSSGTTVLPGDVISTTQGSSAWVRFRSPASTVLMANTEVVLLASSSSPSFLLRHGTVVVDGTGSSPVQIAVPGGFVLVKGDPQTGAECEMATVDTSATVSVKRGLAEVHGQGAPVILRPGQSARVDAGPQGGQPIAGRINKEIPQGTIQRQGLAQELPLTLNAVINWNDLIRTLQAGRAQITLLDGSTLNVGARSSIRILKHDPEKQQTELELTAGQVSANVQKITAPGGKFQLHTKSAVIGTIDTSYVASSDDKGTKICGVDGTTQVQSSDPNITKTVKLHKNECSTVPIGGAPTDPVFAPSQVASMMNQVNVETTAAAGGAAGGAGGIPWTWVAVGAAGAGAAGAAAGIVTAGSGTTSPTTP